jgi:putative FmdB family regulatory protein
MPIYEFYCPDCHTVFSFFSSRVNTEARPACPRCARPELGRRPSTFAVARGDGERAHEAGEGLPEGLDEARFEAAMSSLMDGMPEGADEDPRTMAKLMRSFGEAAGVEPGPRMEEMLRRLEAGEDPDRLEEELGGEEGGPDAEGSPLGDFFQAKKLARSRSSKPRIDKELYFL